MGSKKRKITCSRDEYISISFTDMFSTILMEQSWGWNHNLQWKRGEII